MASAYPGQVTAMEVGTYFVSRYYHVFQQQPDCVHQFYTDASSVIRVDGNTTETANGTMQIHTLVMTKSFSSIEIKTAQSLDSWNGGVLVMISGLVQPKSYSTRRKFMQTFFLAPQEKGYFVLNDIFHYLEEEQQVDHYSTSYLPQSYYESQIHTSTPVVEQASEYASGGELQSEDYADYSGQDYGHTDHEFSSPVHAEENDAVHEYSVPETQHDVSPLDDEIEENNEDEPAPSFSSPVNAKHEPSLVLDEEPVEEPTKHTYASILRVVKGQLARPLPNSAQLIKPATVASDWQHVSQSSSPQTYPAPPTGNNEKFTSDYVEEVIGYEDEGDRSVYVGNLPSSISVCDLEEEFKVFGRIRPNGVTIRNRKEAGVFYAFVEFEDGMAVQNALKASPLDVNGHRIYVEGRRPNGGSSRGRRGRGGRGGYQPTDASRGRFGSIRTFSKGGGSSGQDDKDYNRSRGNGFQPRPAARQEKGILGNQYSRNGYNSYEAAN